MIEPLEPRLLLSGAALVGVDFDSADGTSPINWTLVSDLTDYELGLELNETYVANLVDESGDTRDFDLLISGFAPGWEVQSSIEASTPLPAYIPNHTNPLNNLGGNFHSINSATLQWQDLEPTQAYELYVFAADTIAIDQTVTIHSDGVPIVFNQVVNANELFVNDTLGDSGSDLTTFAQTAIADATGRISIDISANNGIAGAAISEVPVPPGGMLSGTKFEDRNEDGVRNFTDLDGDGEFDPDDGEFYTEPGAAGFVIFVDLDGDGERDSFGNGDEVQEPYSYTDVNGEYQITGVPPGTYNVIEELLPSWAATTPTNGVYTDITVTLEVPVINLDFGNRRAGIFGTKFEDRNANSQRDPGEPGVTNFPIYLDIDQNGVLDPESDMFVMTQPDDEATINIDESGSYAFVGIPPGTYIVGEIDPLPFLQMTPELNEETGEAGVYSFELADGEIIADLDFGNHLPRNLIGVDFDDVGGETPPMWRQVVDGSDHTELGLLDQAGNATGIDLVIDAGGGFLGINPTSIPLIPAPELPRHNAEVDAIGGNVFHDAGATFTYQGLTPGQLTDVYVIGADAFSNSQRITIQGADEPIVFEQQFIQPHEEGSPTLHDFFVNRTGDNTDPEDDLPLGQGVFLNFAEQVVADANGEIRIDVEPLNPGEPDAFIGIAALAIAAADLSPSSITGTKMEDLDGDGIRDWDDTLGETPGVFEPDFGEFYTDPGLPGWTIFLDHNDNGEIDTFERSVVTDANGEYSFTNLLPGIYTVAEVMMEPGWVQTTPGDPIIGIPQPLNVNAGGIGGFGGAEITEEVDFGNTRFVQIGGTVFDDANADGVLDVGETGLINWTVLLESDDGFFGFPPGTTVISTLADENGVYQFDNVVPSENITIRETVRNGWNQTSPSTGQYDGVIESGTTVTDHDFGNQPDIQPTTLVGIDFDASDGASPQNWTAVSSTAASQSYSDLIDESGVATTVGLEFISDGGIFAFDAQTVPNFNTIPDYINSLDNLGGNLFHHAGGIFTWTNLTTGMLYEPFVFGLDSFGNAQEVSITGQGAPLLFQQTLAPNQLNVNDEAGNPVRSLDEYAALVAPAADGTVTVAVSVAEGSDFIGLGGLAIRPSTTTAAQISGSKFEDMNGNGVRDDGDDGLEDWVIYLDLDDNGVLDDDDISVSTDVNGDYNFTGLLPGNYLVREVIEDGWRQSLPGTPLVPAGYSVNLTEGQVSAGNDFGNYLPGAISGTKWEDLDANGIRDPADPSISNWGIFLEGPDDEASTFTSANGNYSFTGLDPGTYTIREEIRDSYIQTFPENGQWQVTITSSANVTDQDFGNHMGSPVDPTSITGFKFDDLNGDGASSGNEPGAAGWTIFLDDNDNELLDVGEHSTVTDAAGAYSFMDLAPGMYTVAEVMQEGWSQSTPAGGTHTVNVTLPNPVLNVNFGNFKFVEIAGTVFDDINGDLIQDPGEAASPGVTVFLDIDATPGLSGGDVTTLTDNNGDYSFDSSSQLPPDEYTLSVVNPSPGSHGITPTDGTRMLNLISGQVVDDADFGISAFSSISGFTWNDQDLNQVPDDGEARPSGWTFFIDLDGDATLDNGEQSTVSDVNGDYSFDDLVPGTYSIVEVLPDGWAFSLPDDGQQTVTVAATQNLVDVAFGNFELSSIDGFKWDDLNGNGVFDGNEPGIEEILIFIDDNANGLFDEDEQFEFTDETGHYLFGELVPGVYRVTEDGSAGSVQSFPDGAHIVNVTAGQTITDINFGNFDHGQISGIKFDDINGNGIQDPNDPGLASWTIFLDTNDDGVLDNDEPVTLTGFDGDYAFTGLVPGTYNVAEVIKPGWGQSLPGTPGGAHHVTLTSGSALSVDFGNFQFAQIHGTKFQDINGNGLRDEGTFETFAGSINLVPTGNVILTRNDDQSTDLIDFGYSFELFGDVYDQFYINNNGNITFTDPLLDFVPDGFPQSLPIISAFWADVDTRPSSSGQVHLARGVSVRGNPFVQVDWPDVGYFANHVDKLNDFTLYVEDNPGGDIVAFIYRDMQWTTGDIDGAGGFGGEGAQIGFDSGDGENFISLGRPSSEEELAEFTDTMFAFTIDPLGIPEGEPGIPGVTVYLDQNNNGALDPGEPTTVTMTDDTATPTIDETGQYWFTDLSPQTNVVREVVPDGFYQMFPSDPNGGAPDSGSLSLIQPDGQVSATFIGSAGVTTDGLGTDSTGALLAEVPADSTVVAAYLHVTTNQSLTPFRPGTIRFESQDVAVTWLDNVDDAQFFNFETGRADVTDIVAASVGNGGGLFNFSINELLSSGAEMIEGTSLTVIYTNPSLPQRSIFVLDGGITGPAARTTVFDLADAVDTNDPDFIARLALGIQSSDSDDSDDNVVEIIDGQFNNNRLTSAAGGSNDSLLFNTSSGGRITIGGINDLAENPADPFDPSVDDDELYDLAPLLTDGDTQFTLSLFNASGDDSIFLAVIEVSGSGQVIDPPIGQGASLVGAHIVSLSSGQIAEQRDFGNVSFSSIAGRKFEDIDNDGVEDPGEPGVPGWTIFLDDNQNGQLDQDEQSVVTDSNGEFLFDAVLAGAFTVAEQMQSGWIQTSPDTGSHTVNVGTSEDVQDILFGNLQGAQIGGAKFEDLNGDGVRDPGDPGLEDWTIFLDENNNQQHDTGEPSTATDANGDYLFDALLPGNYRVREVTQDGWFQSLPGAPGGEYQVTLASGETALDLDFGNYRNSELSGLKWWDENADGVRDASENGLADWTIYLDQNDNLVLDPDEPFTLTDADGNYRFTDLAPGDYAVAEVRQVGWMQAFPLVGDHPVDQVAAHNVALSSGQPVGDIEFGNFQLGEIHGTVSGPIDPDGADGPLPAVNDGIEGFIVFIDDDSNSNLDDGERFAETDADGNFTFDDLADGIYRIVQQPRSLWIPDGGTVHNVLIQGGQIVTDVVFLNTPTGPDLSVTIESLSAPPMIIPNDDLRGTIRVINTGVIAIDSEIDMAVYLSADQAVDAGDALAQLLTDMQIDLDPGQSMEVDLRFSVPQSTEIGDVFIVAQVDSSDQLLETREGNNTDATDDPVRFGWFFGNLEGHSRVKLKVLTDTGTPVTFKLNVGIGEVIGGPAFTEVVLNAVTNRSTAKITTKGRGTEVTIGKFTANGSMNKITAKTTNVEGDIHVKGTLRRGAQFQHVYGPVELRVDQWEGKRQMKLKFADVYGLSIASAAPIGSFFANHVSAVNDVVGNWELPFIKKLKTAASFAANVTLLSTSVKKSIASVNIGQWLQDSMFDAPNTIGTMKLGGARNSRVLVGMRDEFVNAVPGTRATIDDFDNDQAMIKKFLLRGMDDEPFDMIDTDIAVWQLRNIKVARVQTLSDRSHGLAAREVGKYFRQRNLGVSPTTRNASGPLQIDLKDQYEFTLV